MEKCEVEKKYLVYITSVVHSKNEDSEYDSVDTDESPKKLLNECDLLIELEVLRKGNREILDEFLKPILYERYEESEEYMQDNMDFLVALADNDLVSIQNMNKKWNNMFAKQYVKMVLPELDAFTINIDRVNNLRIGDTATPLVIGSVTHQGGGSFDYFDVTIKLKVVRVA